MSPLPPITTIFIVDASHICFSNLTLASSPVLRRGMHGSSRLRLALHFLFGICTISHSGRHSIGTSIGAPLSLTKKTNIFAGLVVLAFRPTT